MNRFSFALPLLLATAAFSQATTNPSATVPTTQALGSALAAETKQHWWNDRVFYEIFVRSFADSREGPLAGDGIGDLRGIIEKLDYLNDGDPKTTNDLGITGLWLMPINPSPSYHGYDITDYNAINPQYGTMDDFKDLLAACHTRGIAVIIDFVANHCAKTHPWFLEAKDPASDKHDWFIWSDVDPGWRGPWNQRVWHTTSRPDGTRVYYYGIFSDHMPDLNYRSAGATEAILDAMRFWGTEIGVDGLRLDAIRHLIETDQVQESTAETHSWLRNEFFPASKAIGKDFVTVGEVWADSRQASSYVGDQMDLVFEFALADSMLGSARTGTADRVQKSLAEIGTLYPRNQFGSFLTNHDQGRVANQLKSKDGPMRSAAAMLLLGPGVPFLYYGEEIGMTGDKPDEHIRTPMQWSAERNAGFSTTPAWQAANKGYQRLNVEMQRNEAGSLLVHYRTLIGLRNASVDLRQGDLEPIDTKQPAVLAFVRQATKGAGESASAALVLVNLSDTAIERCALNSASATLDAFTSAKNLATGESVPIPAFDDRPGFRDYAPVTTISPHGYVVIEFR